MPAEGKDVEHMGDHQEGHNEEEGASKEAMRAATVPSISEAGRTFPEECLKNPCEQRNVGHAPQGDVHLPIANPIASRSLGASFTTLLSHWFFLARAARELGDILAEPKGRELQSFDCREVRKYRLPKLIDRHVGLNGQGGGLDAVASFGGENMSAQ